MNTAMNCRVPCMAGVFHQSTNSSDGRNLHNVVGTWRWLPQQTRHMHKVAATDKVACRQTVVREMHYDRDIEAVAGQGAVAQILFSPLPPHQAPGSRDQ